MVFNFYLKFNADIYVPMPKFSPLWLVQCHCLPTLISCFETGLDSLTLVVRDAYTLYNQSEAEKDNGLLFREQQSLLFFKSKMVIYQGMLETGVDKKRNQSGVKMRRKLKTLIG